MAKVDVSVASHTLRSLAKTEKSTGSSANPLAQTGYQVALAKRTTRIRNALSGLLMVTIGPPKGTKIIKPDTMVTQHLMRSACG